MDEQLIKFGDLEEKDDWRFSVFHIPIKTDRDGFIRSGSGFLIHESGIVATAAHVPVYLGAFPGQTINIFFHKLGVVVPAKILYEGWSGPDLNWLETLTQQERNNIKLSDMRQDVALLKLNVEKAHYPNEFNLNKDKLEAKYELLDGAKVLPLGKCSSDSNFPLRSFCMRWSSNEPDAHEVIATVLAKNIGEKQHQFSSENFEVGDSGSGLWDEKRRVIVGLVRRGVVGDDTVIAASVYAIAESIRVLDPRYDFPWDYEASEYLAKFGEYLNQAVTERHNSLLIEHNTNLYIDPYVRKLKSNMELGKSSLPASISITKELVRESWTLLMGVSGIGKTTVAHKICQEMLVASNVSTYLESRLVPIVVGASELANSVGSLNPRLTEIATNRGWLFKNGSDLNSIAEQNFCRFIVIIDGLDEVNGKKRSRILRLLNLNHKNKEGWLHSVLLTSRGVKEIGKSILDVYKGYEILPFENDQKMFYLQERFCDKAEDVERKLKPHGLSSGSINPLILAIASTIYEETEELPKRPVDLFGEYIDVQYARATREMVPSNANARSKKIQTFLDLMPSVISEIALCELESNRNTNTLGVLHQIRTGYPQDCPSWLLVLLEEEKEFESFFSGEILVKIGFLFNQNNQVRWAHSTIKEICASSAVVRRVEEGDSELLNKYFEKFRDDGWHTFLVQLASSLIDLGKDELVSLNLVGKSIARSNVNPRIILLPVRMVAGGIELTPKQMEATIRQFCRNLMAGNLEMICAELFSGQNDTLGSWELARLERLRVPLINLIKVRLRPTKSRTVERSHFREIKFLSDLRAHETLDEIAVQPEIYGDKIAQKAREWVANVREGNSLSPENQATTPRIETYQFATTQHKTVRWYIEDPDSRLGQEDSVSINLGSFLNALGIKDEMY